jgi:hypothetical protein
MGVLRGTWWGGVGGVAFGAVVGSEARICRFEAEGYR